MHEITEWIATRVPSPGRELLVRYGPVAAAWSGLRRIPIALWHGPTRRGSQTGRLLVAGPERWARYLASRFFSGDPHKEALTDVAIWDLPRTLKGLRGSADLTVVCVDRLAARMFVRAGYLSVPEWVSTRLSVPDDVERFVIRSSSVHRDMTLVRRHGFQPSVTEGHAQIDVFYDSFYLPSARNRYAELMVVADRRYLCRRARHGGILWVNCGGEHVAAALFERRKDMLILHALGALNGDPGLTKQGAIAALYHHSIRLAIHLGCTVVDFKGSRPSLHDGLLRYKVKWGMSIEDKVDNRHDVLVHWSSFNGVIKEFLSHTPLIFRERGGLSAINADQSQSRRALWISGLQQLYMLTASGLQPMVES